MSGIVYGNNLFCDSRESGGNRKNISSFCFVISCFASARGENLSFLFEFLKIIALFKKFKIGCFQKVKFEPGVKIKNFQGVKVGG